MTTHVVAALGRIATRIPMPAQSGHNKHEGYKYSTRDDIFEVVRVELAKEGVIWIPSSRITNFEDAPSTHKGKAQFRTQVAVRVSFYHPEDSEPLVVDFCGESVTTTDRGASMATTTAIRTGLINLFMLTGTDPEEASKQRRQQNVRQSSSAPPKAEQAESRAENENSQKQSNINKLLLNAGCDADTAIAFVKKYIPSVEAKKGVDLPIDRYPPERLQRWFEQLGKYSKEELKAKAEEAVAGLGS